MLRFSKYLSGYGEGKGTIDSNGCKMNRQGKDDARWMDTINERTSERVYFLFFS